MKHFSIATLRLRRSARAFQAAELAFARAADLAERKCLNSIADLYHSDHVVRFWGLVALLGRSPQEVATGLGIPVDVLLERPLIDERRVTFVIDVASRAIERLGTLCAVKRWLREQRPELGNKPPALALLEHCSTESILATLP